MTKSLNKAIMGPMNTRVTKAKNWILQFIQIQLIVFMVSLPILSGWGFEMSILSPIGNLIFTPILTVFLLLSSIIFFLEILCIPNNWIIYLLHQVSNLWIWLLGMYNRNLLIGFTKPPIIFSIMVPIAIILILHIKKIRGLTKNIAVFFALFIVSCAYLKLINTPRSFIKPITCHNGEVICIYNKGKTAIIDPGYIGQRISAQSWMQYTLIPEIIKSCGKTSIDYLIFMQPGKIVFDTIESMLEIIHVKNIYLVSWQGNMDKYILKSFYNMKNTAIANKTVIKRISWNTEHIRLQENASLVISPLSKNLSYRTVTYPALCVTCNIDNQKVKIYSAKYCSLLHSKLRRKHAKNSSCYRQPRISTY